MLSQSLQQTMSVEVRAQKKTRAMQIEAMGEQKIAVALKKAAGNLLKGDIEKNHVALQLRYLHALTSISAKQNSTILFPIPMKNNMIC